MITSFMSVGQVWDNLLSGQPELVRVVFSTLDEEKRAEVLAHLRKMAREPGWHPEQRKSAAAAWLMRPGVPKALVSVLLRGLLFMDLM